MCNKLFGCRKKQPKLTNEQAQQEIRELVAKLKDMTYEQILDSEHISAELKDQYLKFEEAKQEGEANVEEEPEIELSGMENASKGLRDEANSILLAGGSTWKIVSKRLCAFLITLSVYLVHWMIHAIWLDLATFMMLGMVVYYHWLVMSSLNDCCMCNMILTGFYVAIFCVSLTSYTILGEGFFDFKAVFLTAKDLIISVLTAALDNSPNMVQIQADKMTWVKALRNHNKKQKAHSKANTSKLETVDEKLTVDLSKGTKQSYSVDV